MTSIKIPRQADNDYTREAAAGRRRFIENNTPAILHHTSQFSFDPNILPGNIENFSGVVQMPMGFAGPLLINGNMRRATFTCPWRLPKEPLSLVTIAA